MPCYYTGSEIGDLRLSVKEDAEKASKTIAKLRKERLVLTQMLCEVMGEVKKLKRAGLLYPVISDTVWQWWEKHEKQDAKNKS